MSTTSDHKDKTSSASQANTTGFRETQNSKNQSAIDQYKSFFVGRHDWLSLFKYEAFTSFFGILPGALGFLLRSKFYRYLLAETGRGVQWGSNVTLRHPFKMHIGDHTAIDNDCMLCARGSDAGKFRIGNNAIVSRGSFIQSKAGGIEIGAHCSIGVQCYIGAVNDIKIGDHVLIAGQCYIGGGRYPLTRNGIPMKEQGSYTDGPIVIGDDVWIGAGVKILDNITIGEGAVIGAGAVVTKDVAPYSIVAGIPAKVISSRK